MTRDEQQPHHGIGLAVLGVAVVVILVVLVVTFGGSAR